MVRAQVRPPLAATLKRQKAPWFGIRRSLAPWIIRVRHAPQPQEKLACALRVEAPRGSALAWCGHTGPPTPVTPLAPTSKRCGAPSFGPGIRHPLEPWIVRIGPGAQPDQPDSENLKAACASDSDARGTAHATTNERHLTVTQTSGCQRLITESPLRGRPHWSSDKLSSFMPSLATCTKSHSFRKI